jgi:hypothetical protein
MTQPDKRRIVVCDDRTIDEKIEDEWLQEVFLLCDKMGVKNLDELAAQGNEEAIDLLRREKLLAPRESQWNRRQWRPGR